MYVSTFTNPSFPRLLNRLTAHVCVFCLFPYSLVSFCSFGTRDQYTSVLTVLSILADFRNHHISASFGDTGFRSRVDQIWFSPALKKILDILAMKLIDIKIRALSKSPQAESKWKSLLRFVSFFFCVNQFR